MPLAPGSWWSTDDDETRAVLQGLLQDEYIVYTAANGREVLSLLRQFHPDVVVTDLFMPQMSGKALIAAIRAERAWAELPILVMSVGGDEELRLRLIDTAVQDYLTKPLLRERAAHPAEEPRAPQARRG